MIENLFRKTLASFIVIILIFSSISFSNLDGGKSIVSSEKNQYYLDGDYIQDIPLDGEAEPHECRIWGIVAPIIPSTTVMDHLVNEPYSLKNLGLTNDDGWGLIHYIGQTIHEQRGEERAYYDSNFNIAAQQIADSGQQLAMGHVRQASSGAISIPDPHPFLREKLGKNWSFAHNGGLSKTNLKSLIGTEYLSQNSPIIGTDWDDPNVMDSDLYMLYVLKCIEENSGNVLLGISEAVTAIANTDSGKANFLLSDGLTMWGFCKGHSLCYDYQPAYTAIASQHPGTTQDNWTYLDDYNLIFINIGTEPTIIDDIRDNASIDLLMDSTFDESSNSTDLRTNGVTQDWYESRNDDPTLLTLNTENIAGNSGNKAKFTEDGINNAYLCQEFSSPQSTTLCIQYQLYVESILDNSTEDRAAIQMIGVDGIDGRTCPCSNSDERFVYMAAYSADGGILGDTMSLIAREPGDNFYSSTWKTIASNLKIGEWYDIKIILQPSLGIYDVYVNNTIASSNIEAFGTMAEVSHISFAQWNDGSGTFFIDNVFAYPVSNPYYVFVDENYNSSTPGWNYTHFGAIQDGIDAVAENGTVYVYNGTYYENVDILKTINLSGEDRYGTIINGEDGFLPNVFVEAENVIISNFTIQNGLIGIFLRDSVNTILKDNIIEYNNETGILLWRSNNNLIKNNTVKENEHIGIHIREGNYNNTISTNIISDNGLGGIRLWSSSNLIFNNYFNNDNNLFGIGSNEIWNITKTSGTNIIGGPFLGGNYWSDYSGIDTNGDGLGDTNIPYGPGDYLPLTEIGFDTIPPEIENISTIPNNPTYENTIAISADIYDDSRIISTTAYYSIDEINWVSVPMYLVMGDNWNVSIGPFSQSKVYYYIEAIDEYDNIRTTPIANVTIYQSQLHCSLMMEKPDFLSGENITFYSYLTLNDETVEDATASNFTVYMDGEIQNFEYNNTGNGYYYFILPSLILFGNHQLSVNVSYAGHYDQSTQVFPVVLLDASLNVDASFSNLRIAWNESIEIAAMITYQNGLPMESGVVTASDPLGNILNLIHIGDGLWNVSYTIPYGTTLGQWDCVVTATNETGLKDSVIISTSIIARNYGLLSGMVFYDVDGSNDYSINDLPILNAEIVAYEHSNQSNLINSTQSNQTGSYELFLPEGAMYDIYVIADDLYRISSDKISMYGDINLDWNLIKKHGFICGKITNEENDQPLYQTKIEVIDYYSKIKIASTHSDPYGSYSIRVDPGRYELRYSKDNYAPMVLSNNDNGFLIIDSDNPVLVNATLTPQYAEFYGKVINSTSQGIVDATVEVLTNTTKTIVSSSLTDENGNYSVIIAPGTYVLRALVTWPDGSTDEVIDDNGGQGFTIGGNEQKWVTLGLFKILNAGMINGSVFSNEESTPIENALIEIFNTTSSGTNILQYVTWSSSNGEYSIRVAPNNYTLKISHNNYIQETITDINVTESTIRIVSPTFLQHKLPSEVHIKTYSDQTYMYQQQLYYPGDTVFFTVSVFDQMGNPMSIDDSLNVFIINPENNIIEEFITSTTENSNWDVPEGIFYGSYELESSSCINGSWTIYALELNNNANDHHLFNVEVLPPGIQFYTPGYQATFSRLSIIPIEVGVAYSYGGPMTTGWVTATLSNQQENMSVDLLYSGEEGIWNGTLEIPVDYPAGSANFTIHAIDSFGNTNQKTINVQITTTTIIVQYINPEAGDSFVRGDEIPVYASAIYSNYQPVDDANSTLSIFDENIEMNQSTPSGTYNYTYIIPLDAPAGRTSMRVSIEDEFDNVGYATNTGQATILVDIVDDENEVPMVSLRIFANDYENNNQINWFSYRILSDNAVYLSQTYYGAGTTILIPKGLGEITINISRNDYYSSQKTIDLMQIENDEMDLFLILEKKKGDISGYTQQYASSSGQTDILTDVDITMFTYQGNELLHQITDNQGFFNFEQVKHPPAAYSSSNIFIQSYSIIANKSGFTAVQKTVDTVPWESTFILVPYTRIQGYVNDHNNDAVQDVMVQVFAIQHGGNPVYTTYTDENGFYSVKYDFQPNTDYYMKASKSGYTTDTWFITLSDYEYGSIKNRDFSIKKYPIVIGQVTCNDLAVQGLPIWAESTNGYEEGFDSTYTDSDGYYYLNGLPAGSDYEIFVNDRFYVNYRFNSENSIIADLDWGDVREVNLIVSEKRTNLKVEVKNYFTNEPIENALIDITYFPQIFDPLTYNQFSETGTDGSVLFSDIWCGHYTIHISKEGFYSQEQQISLTIPDQTTILTFHLQEPINLNGSVYDDCTVDPIAGAKLIFTNADPQENDIHIAFTDQLGFYHAKVQNGIYHTKVICDNQQPPYESIDETIIVESYPETIHDFYLNPYSLIQGYVTGSCDNLPLSNATVIATSKLYENEINDEIVEWTSEDTSLCISEIKYNQQQKTISIEIKNGRNSPVFNQDGLMVLHMGEESLKDSQGNPLELLKREIKISDNYGLDYSEDVFNDLSWLLAELFVEAGTGALDLSPVGLLYSIARYAISDDYLDLAPNMGIKYILGFAPYIPVNTMKNLYVNDFQQNNPSILYPNDPMRFTFNTDEVTFPLQLNVGYTFIPKDNLYNHYVPSQDGQMIRLKDYVTSDPFMSILYDYEDIFLNHNQPLNLDPIFVLSNYEYQYNLGNEGFATPNPKPSKNLEQVFREINSITEMEGQISIQEEYIDSSIQIYKPLNDLQTKTDENGFFELYVPSDTIVFSAINKDFITTTIKETIAKCQTTNININLMPKIKVAGTVTDSLTGDVIPNIAIFSNMNTTITDDNGEYEILLEEQNQSLLLTNPLYQETTKNIIISGDCSNRVIQCDISLEPNAWLKGSVFDEITNQKINNVVITFSNISRGNYYGATNQSGEYKILLDPGFYNVTFEKPGTYQSYTLNEIYLYPVSPFNQNQMPVIDAVLKPENGSIHGRITDERFDNNPLIEPQPISNAEIQVFQQNNLIASVLSNPEGYFFVDDVVPHYSTTLDIIHPQYEINTTIISLHPGESQEQHIGLTVKSAIINGIIHNETQQPLADTTISIYNINQNMDETAPLISTDSDADGYYELELNPGTYALYVTRENFAPQSISKILIHAGTTITENFTLPTVKGKILFDRGHQQIQIGSYQAGNPWFTGYEGYSYFTDILRENGYLVHTTQEPLHIPLLSNYEALIVVLPTQSFSPIEVQAINSAVSNGLGLFLIGDAYNISNYQDSIHQLSAQYGVMFNEDIIIDKTTHHPLGPLVCENNECNFKPELWPKLTSFTSHPVMDTIQYYYYYFGSSLNVISPSVSLVAGDSDSFADTNWNYSYDPGEKMNPSALSAGYSQNGRISCSGEYGFLSNANTTGIIPFIYEADNLALGLNIIDWLCKTNSYSVSINTTYSISQNQILIEYNGTLFDEQQTPLDDESIMVEIQGPDNLLYKSQTMITGENGSFSNAVSLSESIPKGRWSVQVYYDNDLIGLDTFTINGSFGVRIKDFNSLPVQNADIQIINPEDQSLIFEVQSNILGEAEITVDSELYPLISIVIKKTGYETLLLSSVSTEVYQKINAVMNGTLKIKVKHSDLPFQNVSVKILNRDSQNLIKYAATNSLGNVDFSFNDNINRNITLIVDHQQFLTISSNHTVTPGIQDIIVVNLNKSRILGNLSMGYDIFSATIDLQLQAHSEKYGLLNEENTNICVFKIFDEASILQYSGSLNYTDYNWIAEEISILMLDPGLYTVNVTILSVYDELGYFECELTIETPVNQPPVISQITNQTISEGTQFMPIVLDEYVDDPDNNDWEISWNFSGNEELELSITNNILSIQTPHPDWFGAETITIDATDPEGLSDSKDVQFIVLPVNDNPQSNFTWEPTHPYVNQLIQFTDTSMDIDGEITSWNWSFGDNINSNIQSPSHQYGENGNYTICLTVEDNEGAIDSICQNIFIQNIAPTANFTWTPVNPTTQDLIYFNDTSFDSGKEIISWNWDFGDENTSTNKNPVHRYQLDGFYTINLTIKDDDGAIDSTELEIEILAFCGYIVDVGWNLISPIVQNNWNASDLAVFFPGCEMISRFNNTAQSYDTFFVGGPSSFDFPLSPGEGYFILMNESNTTSLTGPRIQTVSIPLNLGWNLLGRYHAETTMASSLGENITGCEMISKFNSTIQSYDTYFVGGPSSFDFEITAGMGIFVLVDEESTWYGEG